MLLTEFHNTNKPDTVVFSFARMQPPTMGHEKLVKAMLETAISNKADHVLYLSQTNNGGDDPLLWEEKVNICKRAFTGVKVSEDANIHTPFQALKQLCEKYDNVILIVGEDRVSQYDNMHKYYEEYGAKKFAITEAGKRSVGVDGVEGISASIAREYAHRGNYKQFKGVLPSNVTEDVAKEIYNKIRERSNES